MPVPPRAFSISPPPRLHYERRRPEHTALYRVVQEHLATFYAQVEAESGATLPGFVKAEFEAFLECGVLAHGFLRLKCGECRDEKLVAFSCKGRAFYCGRPALRPSGQPAAVQSRSRRLCVPSCGARRMAQSAAHWVEQVLPEVPVRQWVLSLPIPLRYWLAAQPQRLSPVLEVVQRAIAGLLIKKAGLRRGEAKTGAVTAIQRFGSAAGNLNIHFHSLVIDGVYRLVNGKPVFEYVAPPTPEELARLLERIAHRVMRLLTRCGDVTQAADAPVPQTGQGDEALAPLQAAACSYRIAYGPRRGRKLWTLKMLEAQPREQAAGCVHFNGFSLHAQVRCAKTERKKLERLCRYVSRPAIANERLTLTVDGQVVYELKTPYRDGTTHIVLSPLELLQRLAALVPRPRLNLIRYHGVLAPNAAWRSAIVPPPPEGDNEGHGAQQEEEGSGRRPRYISWARLLKRVFAIDITTCSHCGGSLKILAAITDPPVIRR